MITSTPITNTETFEFIAVLVFKLWSNEVLFINRKDINQKLLKSRLLFNKIADFTGKLLQNYEQIESEILGMLWKHVSGHLSVLFQFA